MTYKLYANRPVEHHLLEIILWRNIDGTFRTITNTQARLKKLGCYKEGIMTITMTNSDHTTLHNAYRDYSGARNPMNGKKITDLMSDDAILEWKRNLSKANSGCKNPMYGKNAWEISCSRKTPEQIDATRKSKSEKMKAFWAANKEKRLEMARKVSESKRQRKEATSDGSSL